MLGNVGLSVRRIHQQILGLKVLRLERQTINQTCDEKKENSRLGQILILKC